jgi:hypothetical protein
MRKLLHLNPFKKRRGRRPVHEEDHAAADPYGYGNPSSPQQPAPPRARPAHFDANSTFRATLDDGQEIAMDSRGHWVEDDLASMPGSVDINDDPELPYAVDDVSNAREIRYLVQKTVLVLLLFIGLGLLGGGIYLVVKSDSALPALEDYRGSVRTYEAQDRTAVSLWAGTVNGATAQQRSEVMRGNGNIPSTETVYVTATVPVPSAGDSLDVALTFSPGPDLTVPNIPLSTLVEESITCERVVCSQRLSGAAGDCATSEDPFACNASTLEAGCVTRYGTTSRYSGLADCAEQGACGVCRFDGNLANLCLVVFGVNGARQWEYDPSYVSCNYPFTKRDYSATTHVAALPVTVRSSKDPYLALQRLTRGTGSFAEAPRSTSTGGIAMIVIACVCLVAAIALIVFVCFRWCTGDEDDDGEERGEDGARLSVRERLRLRRARRVRDMRRPYQSEPARVALNRVAEADRQTRVMRRVQREGAAMAAASANARDARPEG